MGIGYGGNHFFDVLGQVKVSPLPFVYLAGGYRYMDLQLEDGNDRAAIDSAPRRGICSVRHRSYAVCIESHICALVPSAAD